MTMLAYVSVPKPLPVAASHPVTLFKLSYEPIHPGGFGHSSRNGK